MRVKDFGAVNLNVSINPQSDPVSAADEGMTREAVNEDLNSQKVIEKALAPTEGTENEWKVSVSVRDAEAYYAVCPFSVEGAKKLADETLFLQDLIQRIQLSGRGGDVLATVANGFSLFAQANGALKQRPRNVWLDPSHEVFRRVFNALMGYLPAYPHLPTGTELKEFNLVTLFEALAGVTSPEGAALAVSERRCRYPGASDMRVVQDLEAQGLKEQAVWAYQALTNAAQHPLASCAPGGDADGFGAEILLDAIAEGRRVLSGVTFLLSEGKKLFAMVDEIISDPAGRMAVRAEEVLRTLVPCGEEEARATAARVEAETDKKRAEDYAAGLEARRKQEEQQSQRAAEALAFSGAALAWARQYIAWESGVKSGGGVGSALALAAAGFLVGGPVGAGVGGVVGLVAGGKKSADAPVPPSGPAWMTSNEAMTVLQGALEAARANG